MAYERTPNLEIARAKLMFCNFAGKETEKNRAGDRNFAVVIDDPDEAERLRRDGWNIKEWNDILFIPVKVRYDNYPPKIYRIGKNGKKKLLGERAIGILDGEDILYANVVISPYHWSVNGDSGIKAYLKTLYVVISEDSFADEFPDEEDYHQEDY